MTPDLEIKRIDGNSSLQEVLDFVVKNPYTRYPVYLNTSDNIIGILDVGDILKYVKAKKLSIKVKKILRKPFFVPESKKIESLLSDFESNKMRMAVVVDEYGAVSGIVTLEDILEEIVGEIFDKSQKHGFLIKKLSNKMVKMDANTPIDKVNKFMKLNLKADNFITLAGFIEHKLQRIPKKGEKIQLPSATIIVDKVERQKIKVLKILKK